MIGEGYHGCSTVWRSSSKTQTDSGLCAFLSALQFLYLHCIAKCSLHLSSQSCKKHSAHSLQDRTSTGLLQGLPNLLQGFLHCVRCATDIGPLPGWDPQCQEAHHQLPHPSIMPPIQASLGEPQSLVNTILQQILPTMSIVLQPFKA